MKTREPPKECFNLFGIYYTVVGDLTTGRDFIEDARQLVQAIKRENVYDMKQLCKTKHIPNGGYIHANTLFGVDSAYIYVPPLPGITKKKAPQEEVVMSSEYVLIVEMRGSEAEYQPYAFAVFTPERGDKLKFAGVTNSVIEDNFDPPGIIGQTTFREHWLRRKVYANDSIVTDAPIVEYEQMKRVDQGYWAYDGDYEAEEVTMNGTYNNLWTYENIEHTTTQQWPTPGPPPPEICGYTWDIYSEYGGTGIADYHDTLHLFYMVKVADELSYWWPDEFNQIIPQQGHWRENAVVCKYVDKYDVSWDTAESVGIESACGHLIFPNTFSQHRIELDQTTRVWGCLYADYTYDIGISNFPYLTYTHMDYRMMEKVTAHLRYFPTDGVYVYGVEPADTIFIQGVTRWEEPYYQVKYWSQTRRGVADPYDLPFTPAEYDPYDHIGILFSKIRDPELLTENQLLLMQGNDPSETWPTNSKNDVIYTYLPGKVMINCSGTEYYITDEIILDEQNLSKREPDWNDYGIFTKDGTGIDKDGNVNPDTVDPIYAYSLIMADHLASGYANHGMIYGMVLDGVNYISDEFPVIFSGPYLTLVEPQVPGTEDARSKQGVPVFMTSKVRVALKKSYIKIKHGE